MTIKKWTMRLRYWLAKRKFPELIKGVQLPQYFSEDMTDYINYEVGVIVPLRFKDGWKAFYRIVKNDSRNYTSVLHHIEHGWKELK